MGSHVPHRTILVVEDDPPTRQLIAEWLPDDALCLTAGTLAEARLLLAEHRPRIVILDLVLPDGEGTSLLEAIPRDAAIIAMSGSQKILSEPGRVVSYLPKPFEPDSLQMLVRQAFRSVGRRA